MAVDRERYRKIKNGVGHEAALILADPAQTGQRAATVAAPAAMTQAAITGGESPTEAEFNALRTDVVNLRTTVANLLTSLKNAGVVKSS